MVALNTRGDLEAQYILSLGCITVGSVMFSRCLSFSSESPRLFYELFVSSGEVQIKRRGGKGMREHSQTTMQASGRNK